MIADAVKKVLNAWTVPGQHVVYHLAAKEQLKETWPALAESLDALEREVNKE